MVMKRNGQSSSVNPLTPPDKKVPYLFQSRNKQGTTKGASAFLRSSFLICRAEGRAAPARFNGIRIMDSKTATD